MTHETKIQGFWLGREGNGYVVEFLVDGVSFEVWKSTRWTDEQVAKATTARPGAVKGRYDETKWMPATSSATTYISYTDWLDTDVNLRVVWLSQLINILMESEHKWVNAPKVGDWRLDGIEFNIQG
jgi:hypothetical protein